VGKGRLEAFSDGVIAIIITIMVLELTPPHDASLAALKGVLPVVLGYVLSFVHVGIYWNNHHHLFQAVRSISGATLWLNLHLLFWLSLMPFATAWMGETGMATVPVVLYGAVLLMCAASYMLLEHRLARQQGANRTLVRAIGKDRKGCLSLVLYAGGVAVSGFVDARLGMALYVVVAAIWFVPDSRIENLFRKDEGVDA
jgi:uncharacterized membrane protein